VSAHHCIESVACARFSSAIPPGILEVVFGVGLVILANFLVTFPAPEGCEPGEREGNMIREKSRDKGETVVEASDGEVFRYPTCWRPPGVAMASAGGWASICRTI
jgi:hypothetical protein